MARPVQNSILVVIGFTLSPLSWWNDVLVNLPLAYLFSLPFSLLDDSLFLPAFVLGYWLTNILGFILMHMGFSGMIQRKPRNFKADFLISMLYTILVLALVLSGILPPPTRIMNPR